MTRLTAKYTMPLSAIILLRGDKVPRTYTASIDDFDVVLTISPVGGARSKQKNERLWTYISQRLIISVSRNETEDPPAIQITRNGIKDYTPRVPYFEQRSAEYSRVASLVLHNAITFLRFQLRQPLLRALNEIKQHLSNPEWSDASGNKIDPGMSTVVVPPVPGIRNQFGVVKLERKHAKLLLSTLTKTKQPSLHAEILSDAQAAAFDGNIRRAVLELAIACEVFAKHTFFGSDGKASQVFEALEDRGKANVRVLDLIDIGGNAVMGKSFRILDINAYTDIDHLFRARNKVAHRGEAVFRDDKGHLHTVDAKLLNQWWRSVEKLFDWAS